MPPGVGLRELSGASLTANHHPGLNKLNTPSENHETKPPVESGASFIKQVGAISYAGLVQNTAHRMPYPFLPEFSRGLGVPIEALVLLMSARSAIIIFAPVLGSLSDRFGRRTIMYISLAGFSLVMFGVSIVPVFTIFVIAMLLAGLFKFLFDATTYAYVGDRVPYKRRGLVIGILEIAWSGAFLIGMPLIGWLMARRMVSAWQAPFPILAAAGLIGVVVLWFSLPHDRPQGDKSKKSIRTGWTSILKNRDAMAALAVGLLLSAASENLNVVLGVWLESYYGLSLAALSLSTAVIGVAELVGEGGVIGLVDRIGKKRAILIGALGSALSYFALPLIANELVGGLIGLFLTFVTFEFTIVATIPLMTELVPAARASLMSANSAGQSFGRMGGALVGNWLFGLGFFWNGAFGALANILAAAILILWVHDSDETQPAAAA